MNRQQRERLMEKLEYEKRIEQYVQQTNRRRKRS